MTANRTRILLAAACLSAGAGGISRVARLTARVLVDENLPHTTLSLFDREPVASGAGRALTARSSRPIFAAHCFAESWSHSHAIYDQAGIARARSFARPGQYPFAVWMHGLEVWQNLSAPRLSALRAARLRLVNSQFTLDRFHHLHGETLETRICWLATESDEAAPRDPYVPTNVLILSRIDPGEGYKGHAELIAAWPKVVAAAPGARLLIAGGGSGVAALRDLVGASPAAASIDMLGHVPEAELDALWARTRVFAMPSRGEGFGLVYIEAMRHAIPVLASVHDAGAEVNIDGETGFNIDLDREGDLAEKLIALLRDPDLSARLGGAGQARWRTHFTYSAFRRRFAPLLKDFVAET